MRVSNDFTVQGSNFESVTLYLTKPQLNVFLIQLLLSQIPKCPQLLSAALHQGKCDEGEVGENLFCG